MGIWIAPKRTIGCRQFFRRYEAAINYSILARAKTNQVEPFAYVRDLLFQLSGHSPPAAAVLLPDVWLTAHPELVGAGRDCGAARCYKIKNLRFDGDPAF